MSRRPRKQRAPDATRAAKLLAWRHAFVGFVLFLLVLGLYAPVVFRGELLIGSGTDILSAVIPYRTAARERLLSGELPLWSAGHFAGMPLLANGQSGATYPPFWLTLPLSPDRAVSLSFVGHLMLAGFGAYLLTLRLVRRRAPQDTSFVADTAGPFLAAALVVFGGSLQGHVYAGHASLVESAAWIPLLLWASHRLLSRPGAGASALLAAFVGLQTLAGHPQISFLSAFLLAFWAGFLLLRTGWTGRDFLRTVGWLGAAGIGGALLGALLVLPLAELAEHSHRSLAVDPWAFANRYKAPALALLNTVLPHPFGVPEQASWWPAFGKWEPQAWVGLTALLLGVVAVIGRPSRARVALASCALLGALLALGDGTPLYRALATVLPLIEGFRVPARFLLLTGFCVPVLAGLAVADLASLRAERPPLRRAAWTAVAVLAVAALFLVGLRSSVQAPASEGVVDGWLQDHGGRGVRKALGDDTPGRMDSYRRELRQAATGAIDDGLVSLAVGGGAVLVLFFLPQALRRKRTVVQALAVFLVLWTAGEAVRFGAHFVATAPGDPRDSVSAADLRTLAEACGRGRLLWWEQRRWNVGLQHPELRGASGYDPAVSWWTNDILNLSHRRMADAARTEKARGRLWMLWPSARVATPTRAWDLLGVRCVLTARPDFDKRTRGRFERRTVRPDVGGAHLYVARRPLPRAAFVPAVESRTEPVDRLTLLASRDFDPARIVVLESDAETPPSEARGTVQWERDEPEHLLLRTSSDGPGWLRLSDTWFPGWEAEVDGQPTPVLRANHAFRAVAVPAGEAVVEMRYRPASVRMGALASALGFLLCVLGGMVAILRRRRCNPSGQDGSKPPETAVDTPPRPA